MYRFFLSCVALLCLAAIGHANDQSYVKIATVKHSAPLAASVRAVAISTRVGDISVMSVEGDELTVNADVWVDRNRTDPSKAGKNFTDHVLVSEEEGVLTIADAHKEGPDGTPWKISLDIGLPRRMPLSARAGVGAVRVGFAEGDLSLQTGVGRIALNVEEAASVRAEAGFGTVDLNLRKVAGNVAASIGSGVMKLQLQEPQGKIEIKCGNGDVFLKLAATPPRQETTIEGGVGDVVLVLPADASGQIDLSTIVGLIDLEPTDVLEAKSTLTGGGTASGFIGDKGPSFEIKLGVGSVRLRVGADSDSSADGTDGATTNADSESEAEDASGVP